MNYFKSLLLDNIKRHGFRPQQGVTYYEFQAWKKLGYCVKKGEVSVPNRGLPIMNFFPFYNAHSLWRWGFRPQQGVTYYECGQ